MREFPIYTVFIRHIEHSRHDFKQQFIGKPTSEDVITFVESMPRRDTYQFVIDLMQSHGLPTQYVTGNSGEQWGPIGEQAGRKGSIRVYPESPLPITSNFKGDINV